jgi:ribosomal protein L37AE/L43A
MQYNKKCKKCGNESVYIGSAQNGYMWLCKKCNNVFLNKTNYE